MDALWCPPKSSWKTWRSAVKSYGTWENSSRCNSPSPSWRISVSWLVGHPMGNQWHSDSHVFRAGWGWWASPYNPIYKYTIHGKSKTWFTLIHQILPGFSPLKHKANPLPDRTVWRCPASESRRPRERCLQGPQYDELKEMWTKCVGLASNIPIRDRNQIPQMNIAYK